MKGFSLVELLVATLVLGIAAAAGLAGLVRANAIARDAAIQLRLQERATYAMGTLEADLQMAGYFGLARPSQGLAPEHRSAVSACGPELPGDLVRAVQVLPAYTLACAAAAGGAAAHEPVLLIRRASVRESLPDAGRWQWLGRADLPGESRLMQGDVLPEGVQITAGRIDLRNLVARAYYIARGSDGDPRTPSLRVKSLTSVSGRPAFIDTEVMPGVQSMQVSLLPDEQNPETVRVALQLQEESTERRTGTASAPNLFSRQFALRNVPRG